MHIIASKLFEPFLKLKLGEVDPGFAIVEFVSNHHLCRRIYQLSPLREHPVSSIFICMHLPLILQVRSKKFAHVFEGTNIPTQPKRSVSPDSHLDVRIQPATGSATTSLASPALQDGLRKRPALVLLPLL